MSDINNKWLAARVQDVRANIAALRSNVAPLQYLQLGWHPPEGGWSVAQVVEHLLITDQSYIDVLQRAMPKAPMATSSEWTPSLIGGFLVRSQSPANRRKYSTPARWRPGPEARANPVEDYITMCERVIDLMRQSDGKDLRRTRLSSPASKLVRINVGDAFMVMVAHTQRHLQQIERIKAHPEFPKD